MSIQSHWPVSLSRFVKPPLSIGSPRQTTRGHKKQQNVRSRGESYRCATTINILPDNVLLEIFDFCQKNHEHSLRPVWKWHLLVHVSRRWRQIVFASQNRLKLQILCTHRTPVKKNLGIWPPFPIVIDYRYSGRSTKPRGEGSVIAALEYPDRICDVRLYVKGSQLGKMATVMKKPVPALTRLFIGSDDENAPTLPSGFLGGSAPCLQKITLSGIPYPTLPTLLLSASDLVELRLHKIPLTGYISPEVMVAHLATLPRLGTFHIGFRSATSRPDRICPPPVARTVLPALTYFEFNGASEYLEDLVARIDGPQLNGIFIVYFNQLVDFQVAQLSKFIDRSVGPKLTLFRHAQVVFFSDWVSFTMCRHANNPPWDWRPARTIVSSQGIDWQVSHISQVLSQFSATLSNVVHLTLEARPEEDRQLEGTDEVEWLHLLRQFSTAQTLHVSPELARHVALALEDAAATEMVAELLPSLDLICVEGQSTSSIEKFATARWLSGHPVTAIDTEAEFEERLVSFISK